MQEIQFDYFRGMEARNSIVFTVSRKCCLPQSVLNPFPVKQRFYTV